MFVGKFEGQRLTAYLKHVAQSIENYNSVDIFSIPVDGRTFRVAILSVDSVAASNHDDPNVIRGMVDRSRRLASPFGGPALLRRYYKRVQLASPVWAVAHVEPSAPVFGGWSSIFSKPCDLVISASYNPLHLPLRTGALHLRAEAWAGNNEDARNIADKLAVFIAMFHSAETSVGSPGSDADVKVLFDSLQVRQEDSRAVLYATVPTGVFASWWSLRGKCLRPKRRRSCSAASQGAIKTAVAEIARSLQPNPSSTSYSGGVVQQVQ